MENNFLSYQLEHGGTLRQRLRSCIRQVPDFPKPGILFEDFTPIFADPALLSDTVAYLATYSRGKVDAIVGIESRGYLLGICIAQELRLPFYLVRKAGKLPPPVESVSYDLEYGSAALEISAGDHLMGKRILIHDDVLASGGTADAAAALATKAGGLVTQFSFLMEIEKLQGRNPLEKWTSDLCSVLI